MNDIIHFIFGYIALKFEMLSILDEINDEEPACNGYKHYKAYYGYYKAINLSRWVKCVCWTRL